MTLDSMFDAGSPKAETALTIRRPDDWHVHLRDGAMLKAVLPFTARQFARGIIMPNLVPPVVSVADAASYRQRILEARGADSDFQPLMTCYLTDHTSPNEIERGFAEKVWVAAKLYPAGATTNAHFGVTDIPALAPVLARMEKIGMPVLIHGEATDPAIDIFDREAVLSHFKGPPNHWSEEATMTNVLQKNDAYPGSRPYDPESIMNNEFPLELFEPGKETSPLQELSASDKSYVASLYPKTARE